LGDSSSCVTMARSTPTLPVHLVRSRLRQMEAWLDEFDKGVNDEDLSAADAGELVGLLGHVTKRCGAIGLRWARRGGKDSPRLVSVATGTSTGAARSKLATMARIESSPELKDAVACGAVSLDQAAVIAPAVEACPSCAPSLLEAATSGSYEELRKTVARTLRAVHSEEHQVALERRLAARRRCRVWTGPDGEVLLEARFSPLDGARVKVAMEKETNVWFKASWKAGAKEPRERVAADALVALITGSARTAGAQVVVRVDATALRRGSLEGDERCEIEGVGPVSLEAARSFLPEATLTSLIRDGVNVLNVTSTTRTIRRRLEMALAERDPTCVVPGCPSTFRLQTDHWRQQFTDYGPTELDNLCRLCAIHHRMKHHEGWRLGGGPGKWKWVAPGRAGPSG
jgi:hypothetical protein